MVVRRFGVNTARGIMLSGLAAGLLALGGCSSSIITGVYGDTAENPSPNTANTSTAPATVDFDPDAECPQVNVPTGASFYGSSKGSQVVISNFARECNLSGPASVTIKVGVEGHAVSASGAGGSYSAPLRITIRDRDERVVYTRVLRVTTSPDGDGTSRFKVVDTSDPITIGLEKPLSSYEILVGFDGKAMTGASTATRKKRRS